MKTQLRTSLYLGLAAISLSMLAAGCAHAERKLPASKRQLILSHVKSGKNQANQNTADQRNDDSSTTPSDSSQSKDEPTPAANEPLRTAGPAHFGGTGENLPNTQPPPFMQPKSVRDDKGN